MPKHTFKSVIIFVLMVCWFNGLISSSHVNAATQEQIATASATATVPSTTPTTGDTTAPTNPILVRPVDNTITGDNKPEFVWRSSTDSNSNTVIYTLYLNGVATYLGISNIGNSTGNGYTARLDGAEAKLLPTISLADGVYTWYVTAEDLAGNVSHSTTWTLKIDTLPPPLTLVDLDTYHNPVISTGSNFDIAGPKDIHFTVQTDPFIEVQINIASDNYSASDLQSPTNANGLAYLYQHLIPGLYTVTIIGIDRGGNTSVLPEFTVTVNQAEISITLPSLPGGTSISILKVPYTPILISSLPATITQIQSRFPIAYLITTLLAIAVSILLIILWRHKYNLMLLDTVENPIQEAIVYHSIPTTRSILTPILVTKNLPVSYTLTPGDHGRLRIRHLSRYSTLTIRLNDVTYLLSISVKANIYTIILG